jgi:hypothetical protein
MDSAPLVCFCDCWFSRARLVPIWASVYTTMSQHLHSIQLFQKRVRESAFYFAAWNRPRKALSPLFTDYTPPPKLGVARPSICRHWLLSRIPLGHLLAKPGLESLCDASGG